MSDSEALLKLKQSFTNTNALDSWEPGSGPCTGDKEWGGLVCFNGIVTGLHLVGMGLSGKIDVEALIAITGLRTISIVNNSFSGSIPEFNRLGALKAIFISGNQFSGEIPPDYFLLSHLIELHLENNQFTGTIPDFNLPTLKSLNLSNNKLKGAIPDSLSKFGGSAFAGNAGLCGEELGNGCNHHGIDLGTDSGCRDYILLIIVVFLMRRRKEEEFDVLENVDESVEVRISGSSRKEGSSTSRRAIGSSRRGSNRSSQVKSSMKEDMVVVNEEKGIFGMSDLMKAAAEVLGTGSLGSAYKAVMATGIAVVVKRMKEMNRVSKEGFDLELRRLGSLQHPNVLNPLGYHFRKEEKLIIYEYIPKGSLLFVLHGDRGPSHAELNWPARLKIVQGIARGLGYLHTELASLDLPHGNLKSSNILLTFDHDPLLSDYGYSPLISVSFVSQALFAYRAPEAVRDNQISPKCDVYCLGIVILEILIGKFPTQYLNNSKGGTDVVEWAVSAIADGREAEVFDPEIASSINSMEEMVKLLHIGVACAESNPEQRPDIKEAIRRIEEIHVDGGGSGGGASHDRTIQVLPSLRDGYGEVPVAVPQSSPREAYGEISLNGSDSLEENPGAGHRSDNFSFSIS
ncbi:hypothetical protein AAG906_029591 [Vitis piasezkii]